MTSAKQYEPDDIKLRELVLYLATLSEGDATFGKVKLNKLLFYADFNAYLKFGKPITGHEYQKNSRMDQPHDGCCPSFRRWETRPAPTEMSAFARTPSTAGISIVR